MKKLLGAPILFLVLVSQLLAILNYNVGASLIGDPIYLEDNSSKSNLINADTIRKVIVNGVKWLIGMQRSDGSWPHWKYEDRPGIYNTWWAMQALLFTRQYIEYPEAVSRALKYLEGLDPGDFRVLQIMILYGKSLSDPKVKQGVSRILENQNSDGSWSLGRKDNGALTALHLWVLSLAGMKGSEEWRKGLEYVYDRQLSNGSWVLWWTGEGDPGVTCTVVLGLLFSGVSVDDPHIRKALSFIKSSQSRLGAGRLPMVTTIWSGLLGA